MPGAVAIDALRYLALSGADLWCTERLGRSCGRSEYLILVSIR